MDSRPLSAPSPGPAARPGPGPARQGRPPHADVVTRQEIERVESLIRPYVRRTPVLSLDRAELGGPPGPLVLKLEHLQHSGSFKARGAFAHLLLRQIPAAGVVAASGGNHGAAVACAARRLGVPARVYVPDVSSPAKIARIREYGADLVVTGSSYADALAASQEWASASGALAVHAFDQPQTILGAGTIAVELAGQAPQAAVVAASVGGGGLLAGIAAGCAGLARVVGAEPEEAPTMTAALRAGKPVDAPVGGIAVDSLAPRRAGEVTYPIIAALAAGVALVSDEQIRRAQALLWDRLRLVAEPGGCAALAAVIWGACAVAEDETVAVVISGANTTAVSFGP